jgi:putative transposase
MRSVNRWCVPVRVERSETRAGTHQRPELKTWVIEVFLEVSYSTKKEPAMTHQDECLAIDDLAALLIEHGPAAMAAALAALMNHAMQIEREQVLQAESHQRTADRRGYANGFKPKILTTRVGRVDLRIPLTLGYRDEDGRPFYPRSLERGVRSERALTLAVAEMYVQGVGTPKVTTFVQELCGLDITSTQVSRVLAELDEQFGAWRC